MPIFRYRSLAEAERALPVSPDADTGVRTAITLGHLDEATRRGIRVSQVGLLRYHNIAQAEQDRYAFALQQLQAADERG